MIADEDDFFFCLTLEGMSQPAGPRLGKSPFPKSTPTCSRMIIDRTPTHPHGYTARATANSSHLVVYRGDIRDRFIIQRGFKPAAAYCIAPVPIC